MFAAASASASAALVSLSRCIGPGARITRAADDGAPAVVAKAGGVIPCERGDDFEAGRPVIDAHNAERVDRMIVPKPGQTVHLMSWRGVLRTLWDMHRREGAERPRAEALHH
jgi:hypothetical protein